MRYLARKMPQLGFALRSVQGRELEASPGFLRHGDERLLSLVRLFNCAAGRRSPLRRAAEKGFGIGFQGFSRVNQLWSSWER